MPPLPYGLLLKLGGGAIALAALLGLALSWSSRGQEIIALTAWQNAVIVSVTDATVEPNAKGIRKPLTIVQVPAAIAGLKRGLDSCQAARVQSNLLADGAKQRADLADKALATANVLFRNEYGSVSKRIEALAHTKAAPTPELQCQAIGADSKAAWEGWK